MRATIDVVLDASAAVDLLLGSRVGTAVGHALPDRSSIHVPELFHVEVVAALRGAERGGTLSAARATAAVEDLFVLPVIRWAHSDDLLRRGWELRGQISTYDAIYLALAMQLDATLVTTDARLASAIGTTASVVVPR